MQSNIHKLTINDSFYPQSLKVLPDAPKELYVKGNISIDIFNKCISVVGTRNPTEYGYRITSKLVTHLNINNLTVVSGFMYGIDNAVHLTCVSNKSPTIAVLPFGINKKLVKHQQELVDKIIHNNGLVISEYPDCLEPKKWMFVRRNRIVSALSSAVVLIEGSLNSGTLTTARIALSQQKKVYAICGHIDCDVAKGVNQLIKSGKASLLDDFNDVIKFYYSKNTDTGVVNDKGLNTYSQRHSSDFSNSYLSKEVGTECFMFDNDQEKQIFEYLKQQSLSIDQLVYLVQAPVSQISTQLVTLQVKGLIKDKGGVYYVS